MSGTELAYQPAKLPSRGVLYDGKIPDGDVEVRKWSATEEALLLGTGSRGLERMERTLKNCIKLPNDFKHSDLLMTDRLACMLALRTVTLGSHYEYTFKCNYCPEMSKAEFDILEDLDERTPEKIAMKKEEDGEPDWTLAEPVTVELPDEKKTLELRFLRGHDEARIMKRSKKLLMQSTDSRDPSYHLRMALQIVTIDGEEKDLGKREMFVRRLSGTDTAVMRIAVEDVEPGIDLRVYPECRACGAVTEMPMPFTVEFFRPTRLRPRNA